MLARIHAGRSIRSTTRGTASERNPVVLSIWSSRRGMMAASSPTLAEPVSGRGMAAGETGRDLFSAPPIDRRLSRRHDATGYSSRFRFDGYCMAVTFFR